MKQIDMFSGSCPRHGPENICNLCPDRFTTDGWGFPHPHHAKRLGKVPLQLCERCATLVRKESWNVKAWCCKGCVGLEGAEKGLAKCKGQKPLQQCTRQSRRSS